MYVYTWLPSFPHLITTSELYIRCRGTKAQGSKLLDEPPLPLFFFLRTMSSRLQATSSTSESLPLTPHNKPVKAWVDPASLPHYDHESPIKGNVPDYVKQLNYNTFMSYGVGDEEDGFGFKVGKAVKFVEVNVNKKLERQGRLEATTIAEIVVTKRV